MNAEIELKVEQLRQDYTKIKGVPFKHFFCSILQTDEDSPICKAHIINAVFPNSPRNWTVQRTDVDNFYGSMFESDFTNIRYKDRSAPGKAIVDKSLSKKLNPKILIDDKPVEYFVLKDHTPDHVTPLLFEHGGKKVWLGLKIAPEDLSTLTKQNWGIEIRKDFE